jgi:HK97 gp10 family phage protein
MFTIDIDVSPLAAKLAAARAELEHDLMRATWTALDRGYDRARAEVPVKTGALQSRIRKRITSQSHGARGELRVHSAYARSIDEGSRPHVISAKNAPFLRFRGRGGGWVSKKSVNHPGTKAQPFMARARDEMRETLTRNVEQAVRRFASRFRSR